MLLQESRKGTVMAKGYIVYNNKAGKEQNLQEIMHLKDMMQTEVEMIDVATIGSYREIVNRLEADDYLLLCGGDGTLNCFVNQTEGFDITNEILYYPNGTGNDFANDLKKEKGCEPFRINDYLKKLPTVTVKNKTYRFINGVGFGIDGYCCEVGDEIKKTPGKKVDYTAIAIKGLLFYFKPANAVITVDGKKHTYQKVWIAPTMHGRFYGGGIMPTPNQQRNNEEGMLSAMVFHRSGKLKTLMIFPSLFKGEHLKHTKYVEVLQGKDITVEFDKPCSLQVDGETILNVTSYHAVSSIG